MCTLTFVPGLPLGGYLLAHNRDESLKRGPGLPPVLGRLGEARLMAPRDTDAGGTWIGVDDRGRCLAILNGDGVPAAPAPDDARSRGLLVLDLLQDARPAAVRADLERLVAQGALRSKPFKLVAVEPGGPAQARLLRIDWDGERLAFADLAGPQCIVSSTFQGEAVADARRAAFARLLATLPLEADGYARITDPEPVAAALRAFHASHSPSAPQGDAFSVCMHRPDARTVSRTLLLVGPREIRMEYTPGSPCLGAPGAVTTMERSFGEA